MLENDNEMSLSGMIDSDCVSLCDTMTCLPSEYYYSLPVLVHMFYWIMSYMYIYMSYMYVYIHKIMMNLYQCSVCVGGWVCICGCALHYSVSVWCKFSASVKHVAVCGWVCMCQCALHYSISVYIYSVSVKHVAVCMMMFYNSSLHCSVHILPGCTAWGISLYSACTATCLVCVRLCALKPLLVCQLNERGVSVCKSFSLKLK